MSVSAIDLHWVQRPGTSMRGMQHPTTVLEALHMLADDPSLRPVAGGTDLVLELARSGVGGQVDLLDLTHVDGFRVLPGLTVPDGAIDVTVNSSGEVLVQLDGQITPQNVGQFELANFSNEAGLLAVGYNLYLETPASGSATSGNPDAAGFGRLQQGFLETSNVNVVEEITNLITAQRAYEMNSKVIETSDQMMATMTNVR